MGDNAILMLITMRMLIVDDTDGADDADGDDADTMVVVVLLKCGW